MSDDARREAIPDGCSVGESGRKAIMIKRMISAFAAMALAASVSFLGAPAGAQEEFKIGVVASLPGGFPGPAKDSMDGIQAWIKLRGLKGKKIVLETLDDETN